jgi:hypothetical protein
MNAEHFLRIRIGRNFNNQVKQFIFEIIKFHNNTPIFLSTFYHAPRGAANQRKEGSGMGERKNQLNAFGLEVTMFCAQHGIKKKDLAARAGVECSSIWKIGTGQRTGVEVIPLVRAAMEDYIRESGEIAIIMPLVRAAMEAYKRECGEG